MKSRLLLALLGLGLALAPARAEPRIDWDEWYDGDVDIRLRVAGGAGTVVAPGGRVELTVRVDEDAYVAVFGIDAEGFARWLFPRFWDDDGWVRGGEKLRLVERALAYPLERCTAAGGLVVVQAVASPVPFDWRGLGLVRRGSLCEWWRDGRPWRIQVDPYEGLNDINRALFPIWDEAVFVADHTYFYVGHRYEHQAYLCGVCAGRTRGHHEPWLRVRFDVVWEWQRGRRYCRPVYRPVYVYRDRAQPQRHVVPAPQASFSSRRPPARAGDDEVRERRKRVEVPGRQRHGHEPRSRDRDAGRRPGDRSPSPEAPEARELRSRVVLEAWEARRGAAPAAPGSSVRRRERDRHVERGAAGDAPRRREAPSRRPSGDGEAHERP